MTVFAYLKTEPVRFVAAVQATLALAVAFGLELSERQFAAIILCISAWLSFWVRQRVTPVGDGTV